MSNDQITRISQETFFGNFTNMHGCFSDGTSENFMGINQPQMDVQIKTNKDLVLLLADQSDQIAFDQISRSQNTLLFDFLFVAALHQLMNDL